MGETLQYLLKIELKSNFICSIHVWDALWFLKCNWFYYKSVMITFSLMYCQTLREKRENTRNWYQTEQTQRLQNESKWKLNLIWFGILSFWANLLPWNKLEFNETDSNDKLWLFIYDCMWKHWSMVDSFAVTIIFSSWSVFYFCHLDSYQI